MGATPYILHENCIKNKKYYFKARVNATSGKNSSWTNWVGKIAGDTVMPAAIETSHISSVSNPQQQVSYYINDTYDTPGDFETFRWYAVRRASWISPHTWQDSYADNYYEGTRKHTYTLKAERQYPIVWDIFVGVMDVAGNINIPNTPQLVGVVPVTQVNLQDYSHDVEVSSVDLNTVAWSVGTLMLGNNERYNIAANSVGGISQETYIYLDTAVSNTELQTTITASGATGPTKKLIAVAKNSANEAIFQTFGGIGGLKIRSEHIEAASIVGNNISAATTIIAGTGNNIAALDGADALWRLYAGHATPASAPFRVDQAGQMYATAATIEGSITANTGTIGGWVIEATKLTSDGGGVALDSQDNSIWITNESFGAQGIQLEDNSGAPRAYIGDGSNKYFQFDGTDLSWKGVNTELTAAGQLSVSNILATGGTVGGWALAANSLTGGANDHIKAGQTDFATGTGFFLGHDGSDYKFSIGSASRNLEWDGVVLTVGGVVLTGLRTGSEPSIQGWSHDLTFSAANEDTVQWAGGGTITLTNGDTFSIANGDTGSMSAASYIYLDKDTSSTVLQITTNPATAVGSGKILLAVAQNNSGSDATFQTFGGQGGAIWKADNIAANTITANEIAANTITAAEIKADTITVNEMAANSITAVEIAASTILASNIRAGTISGMNIAANARIVAGTGNDVAILDGDHETARIYAGNNDPATAPFLVTQAGALTATTATIKTAAGTGQRVEMSSATNDFKWFNSTNDNVLSIGANAYGGYAGLSTLEGVLSVSNSNVNPWCIQGLKTINTTPASNNRSGVYGFASSTVDGIAPGKKAIGVWGEAGLEEDSGVTTDMHFVGLWGNAFQTMGDYISGDIVGVWGTAYHTPNHSGAAWAIKSEGNLLVTGKTVNQGKLQLSGPFETSAGMTISGQAGEDPQLVIKSYSTSGDDHPLIRFEHERDGGGTSGVTMEMHEYAFKINCDEDFFLTANGNRTMHVNGASDVFFYQDVTISGQTQMGGRGAAVDCITVTDEGTLVMHGKATVWDDLRVPVTSLRVPGSKAPTWTPYSAGQLLAFNYQAVAGNEEEVYFVAQLPHSYKEGTDITPHVHWIPDTNGTGNLRWGLEYEWVNRDGTFSGTTTIYADHVIDQQTNEQIKTFFSAINGSGKTISSMLICRLFRNSSHANDDLNNMDPLLLEIDFHFEMDTVGSREILAK